ncbi:hypothetical protein LINPERHAP2_LOCUS37445 [Linum perenne]
MVSPNSVRSASVELMAVQTTWASISIVTLVILSS